ncbi:lipopolysaccharide transport periplasmic protein LptA [bacterium]|nr:lipopolysaccharide transport periplasmic protein LptA [bacterium]
MEAKLRFLDHLVVRRFCAQVLMGTVFAVSCAPVGLADLVEEVEDLDRLQRTEQQTMPAVSESPRSPKPAGNDPGVPSPKAQEKGKSRGSRRKAARAPVQFESKALQAMKDQNRVMLKEDVIVTQGDFRLEADEATIYFDPVTREADKVIAIGRVKVFKSDPELKQRVKAECNEAVFHNQDRKMILRGNAKLWRGEDLVRGKQITYELDTGWIKADRVEGVVQPGGRK